LIPLVCTTNIIEGPVVCPGLAGGQPLSSKMPAVRQGKLVVPWSVSPPGKHPHWNVDQLNSPMEAGSGSVRHNAENLVNQLGELFG
jgi:hypothetical protein